ncbi:nuclear protein DGCR14 [Lipomyces arxii]|uniref:nuclear protein DGCR14 n=1 Tax=Lipomyces arxii TaxID=56418 RepID=UPI0034CED986
MDKGEKQPSKGLSLAAYQDGRAALMLPPPPPIAKRRRPAVTLDEDTYVQSISKIIERDYFPVLVVLRCKNAYLDALSNGDDRLAAKLRRKLDRLTAPDGVENEDKREKQKKRRRLWERKKKDALYRAGTPMIADSRAETPRLLDGNGTDSDSSDSDYSGDDVSDPAYYDTKTDGEANTNLSLDQFQAKYTSEDNEAFNNTLDESNQKQREKYSWLWNGNRIPGAKGLEYLEWKKYNAEEMKTEGRTSTALVVADRNSAVAVAAAEKPAKVADWKSKPRNELIFEPDGGKMSAAAQMSAQAKEIKKANSRFHEPEMLWERGLAYTSRKSSPSSSIRTSRESSPTVNGYSFFSAMSPAPSEPGTPRRSNELDLVQPGSKFRIMDTPKREELHHRLLSSTKQTSKSVRGTVPTFNGPHVKKAMLTPAGKRLVHSIVSERKKK